MKTRAAVLWGKDEDFEICDVELEPPHSDEILVKITACGFCHTDELVRTQAIPVSLPAVLGHEGSGIVESVGADVTEFKPGDRVAISFGSCGKCDRCLDGWPTLCNYFTEINFSGVHADGTSRLRYKDKVLSTFFAQSSFAEYAITNERNAVKIPCDVPLEITGPLGCGIQTGAGAVLNRIQPRPGSRIAVFGCGSVGLSAIMAAKIANCGMIIGIDIVPSRLEIAKELGATIVINSLEVDPVNEITRLTGIGADHSVDSTGKGICTRMALQCVKSGGQAIVIGGGGDMSLNVEMDLMSHAKSLVGVVEGDSNPKIFIPELIEHYRAGRFPFDKLISYYNFNDINTAMHDSAAGRAIKAVLTMEQS